MEHEKICIMPPTRIMATYYSADCIGLKTTNLFDVNITEQVTYDTLMSTAYLDIPGIPPKRCFQVNAFEVSFKGYRGSNRSNREKQAEAGPKTFRISFSSIYRHLEVL